MLCNFTILFIVHFHALHSLVVSKGYFNFILQWITYVGYFLWLFPCFTPMGYFHGLTHARDL